MTPTSAKEARHYWSQLCNIRPNDAALFEVMTEDDQHAFEEGRAVLAEVQIDTTNKTMPHFGQPIYGDRCGFGGGWQL
jgi:hypothetical protein